MTTAVPYKVPDYLPSVDASNHEWIYWGNALYHNQARTDYSHLPSLDDCQVSNEVGLFVTPTGELHLFLDKKHICKLTTQLPVQKALFGAVNVCGRCSKIKSEMLSGELDIVCIYMHASSNHHLAVHRVVTILINVMTSLLLFVTWYMHTYMNVHSWLKELHNRMPN